MFAQLIYKLTFGTYPIHTMVASFKEHIVKYTQHHFFITLSVMVSEESQHCPYSNKEVKRFLVHFMETSEDFN